MEWVAGAWRVQPGPRWAFPQNHWPVPLPNPRTLSASAAPPSLIYSLFYLCVWSGTLCDQRVEGISPRGPFLPHTSLRSPLQPAPMSASEGRQRKPGGARMGGQVSPLPCLPFCSLSLPPPFLSFFCTLPSPCCVCSRERKEGARSRWWAVCPQDGSQKPYSEWAVLEPRRAASLPVGE